MLSVFPSLFTYALVVPFVFRIIVGAFFIYLAYATVNKDLKEKSAILENLKLKPGLFWLWIIIFIEIVGGVLLIAGLFTQVASLALSILIALNAIARWKNKKGVGFEASSILLLLVITLSLIFLGPGFYAFDLPL